MSVSRDPVAERLYRLLPRLPVVREIIRIRLYGLEHVQRIAAARLEAVAGKGPRQGPQGDGS